MTLHIEATMHHYESTHQLTVSNWLGDIWRLLTTHWRSFILLLIIGSIMGIVVDLVFASVLRTLGSWTDTITSVISFVINTICSAIAVCIAARLLGLRDSHAVPDGIYAARRIHRFLAVGLVTSALSFTTGLGSVIDDLIGPLLGALSIVLSLATLYLALRLMVAEPAIAVDDLGIGDSLSYSWDATRGHVWRLVGYTLAFGLCILPVLIVLVLFAWFVGFDDRNVVFTVISNLLGTTMLIMSAVSYVFLYVGLRNEKLNASYPPPTSVPQSGTPASDA